MAVFEEVKNQMQEYSQTFDVLLEFEQRKFEAVKEKDLDVIDEYLKEEQAYLLQLRGFDQKREALLKANGYSGYTFRQIINEADGEEKADLENLYTEIEQKIDRFKKLMKTIDSYIDLQLFSVESAIEKIHEFEGKQQLNTYEKDAKSTPKEPKARFKSTKA
ncbi:MAG: flagellar protein FlgN [Eubacteriales bacterium]